MSGYTFVDYVKAKIIANQDKVLKMSTGHRFNSSTTPITGTHVSDIQKALILAQSENDQPNRDGINNFPSPYRTEQFTVLSLYQDYLQWLISNGVFDFSIDELFNQLCIIAAYQRYVIATLQNQPKAQSKEAKIADPVIIPPLVSCPAVPQYTAAIPDCKDSLKTEVESQIKALDKVVYDAVVDAVDKQFEAKARDIFYPTIVFALIALAGFANWMAFFGPHVLPWVPGLLGGIGSILGAIAVYDTYLWFTRGRLTNKVTSPEEGPDELRVLKRAAIDNVLTSLDIKNNVHRLANIISSMPTEDVKQAVAATTHCFITARYATQYRQAPVGPLKADNGKDLIVDLLPVQTALSQRLG